MMKRKRLTASAATASVAAVLVLGFPVVGHAAAGLEAIDDRVHQYGRGSIEVDVLANDLVDPDAHPKVVDVQVLEAKSGLGIRSGDVVSLVGGASLADVPTVAFNRGTVVVTPEYASLPDSATVRVRLRVDIADDFGQRASSILTVSASGPRDQLVARSEVSSRVTDVGIGYSLPGGPSDRVEAPSAFIPFADSALGTGTLWDNDQIPLLSDVRIDVVEQPSDGRIVTETALGYTLNGFVAFQPRPSVIDGASLTDGRRNFQGQVFERVSEPVDQSFSYRICPADSDTGCSGVATAAFVYRLSEGIVPFYAADEEVSLTPSSAASFNIDLADVVVDAATPFAGNQAKDALYREQRGLRFAESVSVAPHALTRTADYVEHVGGTIWKVTPPPLHDRGELRLTWLAKDDAGRTQVVVGVGVTARLQPVFDLADDQVWVAVGGTGSEPVLSNDPDLGRVSTLRYGLLDNWITDTGGFDRRPGAPRMSLIDEPTLGSASVDGLDVEPVAESRFRYQAGPVPGVDRIRYSVCDASPVPYDCGKATVTVHVAPLPIAVDDYREVQPGQVTVPVLDNDTFTDVPALPGRDAHPASVLTESIAPVAMVNSDRTVTIDVPESARGTTLRIPYTLRDFTGAPASGAVVLDVTDDGVTAEGPRAVDDAIAIEPEAAPVAVEVLANDSYGTNPTVSIGVAPAGLTASLENNQIVVAADRSLRCTTIDVPYVLTDDNGSSSAVVHVDVGCPIDTDPAPPDAIDDVIHIQADGTVATMDLLDNDLYFGDPSVVADLADEEGLTIDLQPDGTIAVSAAAELAGRTFTRPYKLLDSTGMEDTALVSIVVDELPSPGAPVAEDDATTVAPGVERIVDELANDVFSGGALVRLVGQTPDGLAATVVDEGILIEADASLSGQTVRIRYELTDDSGFSDQAYVSVEVTETPVIVTGADRALPTSDRPETKSDGWAAGLLLPMVGAFAAAVGARALQRRRRTGQAT